MITFEIIDVDIFTRNLAIYVVVYVIAHEGDANDTTT